MVTSYEPLRIYIYREGLVRFATEKYDNEDLTREEAKYSHLTNYSINKNNTNFMQNDVSSQWLIILERLRAGHGAQMDLIRPVRSFRGARYRHQFDVVKDLRCYNKEPDVYRGAVKDQS